MKTTKTLEQILDIIEAKGISIDNYEENGKLCGYELDTYTAGGVNQIIFLDFRNEGQGAENANDFIEEFNSYVRNIDIDEEIELNRQDQNYKDNFTLRQSLDDFEKWKAELEEIAEEINK